MIYWLKIKKRLVFLIFVPKHLRSHLKINEFFCELLLYIQESVVYLKHDKRIRKKTK